MIDHTGEIPIHLALTREQLGKRIRELEAENERLKNTMQANIDEMGDTLEPTVRYLVSPFRASLKKALENSE